MSEDDGSKRPAPDGFTEWPEYWKAQGMLWRTEPEIDGDRKAYLAMRRAVRPDIEKGIYHFHDENGSVRLDRADVEWLLATHESRGKGGPVWWEEEKNKPEDERRVGLDLRGADLRQADLRALPLACMLGGLALSELPMAYVERPDLELPQLYEFTGTGAAAVHLEGADLHDAHLEHAQLALAHLARVGFGRAHLEGAQLLAADLENAVLSRAHLEGTFLFAANLRGIPYAFAIGVHFEQADLRYAYLDGRVLVEAHLEDADLRGVSFTDTTYLNGAWLGSQTDGLARLVDIKWRGTNLAQVQWVGMTGRRRRKATTAHSGRRMPVTSALVETQRLLRATQQLALVLRSQGLNDSANELLYHAQVLQRRVNRLRGRLVRSFGSWLLDLISGYGYRPLRSIATYLLVVTVFGLAYWALGVQTGHTLTWNEAGVVSLTAFHGRGFFQTAFQPGDPQAALAAIEAVIGLLIEIVFIATFTQRFFAR